jgi:hypothetical protein
MVNVHIYFIHAKWLQERTKVITEIKKHLSKFKFTGINIKTIQTIEEFDPTDIQSDTVQKYVNYTQIQDSTYSLYNQCFKNLHIYQLSNALKHAKAIELASKNPPEDINIILEDDLIFEERLCISLEKVIKKLDIDFDLVFLGLPTNKEVKNKTDMFFQNTKDIFRILPYCDSYILSHKAAKSLVDKYLPIKFINNIQLSYMIDTLNLKSQIAVPNMFMDGSKYGTHISSLNGTNALLFNNEYNILKHFVSKETPLTQEEEKNLQTVLENSSVKNHPDFCHLKALLLVKDGKYNEAKKVFEETYQKYKNSNCIVNHESAFLKDYIRIFKHLQTDI